MDSTTFLPTYDPALLEPIASPSLTENSITHIKSENDFLFPPSAYEDSLSSFPSASQSPSYSPKCSSVDSEIYLDMDRKSSCVTPDHGIGMLSSGESYSRQSWSSDMNGASYHQHQHSLGYTYSPNMHHQPPPAMMVPSDSSFWQTSAPPSFYQSNTPSWSQPGSIASDDSYRMSLSNITHRRESLASPAKPRSMRDSKRKSGSSPSMAGRAAPYARRPKMLTPERNESTNTWDCVHCQQAFRDLASLDKHIKSEHTRPLICVFHWAGCTSRFASKNEWKRHVFSQHLALKYWICTEGSCGEARNALATRRRSSSLPAVGCIFNRKDLYTQHVRRMHLQPDAKRGTKKYRDMDSAASDDFVRDAQTRAARTRCELPTFMSCPAEGCDLEFHGPTAWDDRMEHVASHLERAAAGEEPAVAFGGLNDWTLTSWAEQADVEVVRRSADGWVLCNPLKSDGSNSGSSSSSERRAAPRVAAATPAEDAEGEDQYSLWPNSTTNGLAAPAASTTA